MDIAIIVPFHNEERYIEACIKALLAQDYPSDRYEILMINNNSTDRSVEIVNRFANIKLFQENKPGAFAARNRGICETKAPIIAFTDADCVPNKDWLSNIKEAMMDSAVAIVQGTPLYKPDSIIHTMLADYESEKANYIFSSDINEIYYGSTNNMAIRIEMFKKLGRFSEIARGADGLLVQNAINSYSCGIVRYSIDMCVRHLEITNLWQYYRKLMLYGKDFKGYCKDFFARPLNQKERLLIFKNTIQKRRYPLSHSVCLLPLLCIGGICYELGRWQAVRKLRKEIK